MTALWWLAIPVTPLLGALLQARRPASSGAWLWLCCLPALAAALWPPPELAPQLWPGASWGVDGLRRGLLAVTAGVWLAATLYAGRDRPGTAFGRWFWTAWMLTFAGNLLLLVSLDAAGFYVGYSVMSLSAYILIVHGWDSPRRKGGRIYLQLAMISELLIFAGMMLRFDEAERALALSSWQLETSAPLTAALLLTGFGIKLCVWPLHFWAPFAYFAARPMVCAVLSGAMLNTALLGLWTFLPVAAPVLSDWNERLLLVAAISAFYGVFAGLAQRDVRKILAHSSISQAGYLLAIVVLAWHRPALRAECELLLLMFAVHHGLAKSALFLGAGLAASRPLRPIHWLLMAIPALALAGLPLTTGAVVKTLLSERLDQTVYASWHAVLTVGSLATALLVLRALLQMYRGQPASGDVPHSDGRMIAWLGLSAMALLLPWLWPAMFEPLQHSLAPDKVLTSLGLLALAFATTHIASRLPLKAPRLAWRDQPGMVFSSKLKGLIDNATLPLPGYSPDRNAWRRRERRWNHYWTQRNAVTASATILGILILVGIWTLVVTGPGIGF